MSEVLAASSDIKMDYMKLLVAELQNQNPLEPMDNNEMASQLSQFSMLEQMESMNSNFAKTLESIEHDHASSLLGKEVSYYTIVADGSYDVASSRVTEVIFSPDEGILLSTAEGNVALGDVVSVRQ